MVEQVRTSRVSGFYKLSVKKRLEFVADFANLTEEEKKLLLIDSKPGTGLDLKTADMMIENVIGTFDLPLGVAVNFLINERDYLIPMVIEESSVVAAASNAAKVARVNGGFKARASESIMIGQIQVVGIQGESKLADAMLAVRKQKDEILNMANEQDKVLVGLGGGAKDLETRIIKTSSGEMLIVHLLVDVKDAMGANAVNTMCEAVAPLVEEITGGKVRLRIISNLADKRLAYATAVFDKNALGGSEVVDGILEAYAFADADPYRAATHNKGIMNGVDAVVIAVGNDWRAVEAGAHAYAARYGRYKPLTRYWKNRRGDLVGEIEIPLAIGTVGGAASVNPLTKLCRKILGVKNANELACVIASVGLAQNLAALRALAVEGIQRGHMSLHAKNIAVMAGAKGDEIDIIARKMVEEKKVRLDRAKEILEEIRRK
ncbi:MAG: hydroxymethylglutaryl-CoA reductase, degradative [Thermoplasmata archaeon]|nr:MAG: hydroxymethylglutaryl-CoA reductase, degradative [Thermoplasmata archaeon]